MSLARWRLLGAGVWLSLALAIPAEAATWWVSPDGSDTTGSGTKAAPFLTVGRAVSIAAEGDTVRVLPGIYHECVDASAKSLAFVSDAILQEAPNNRNTVLDGTALCGGSACGNRPSVACYRSDDSAACLGACDDRVCSVTTTARCTVDDDCPTGETCSATSTASVCSTTTTTRCTLDTDCPSGETCSITVSTGVCESDRTVSCVIDVCVIPSGEIAGTCRDHPSIHCGKNDDCANLDCHFGDCERIAGLCGGVSGASCFSDADCAEGVSCEAFAPAPVVDLAGGSSLVGFTVRGGSLSGVRLTGSGTIARNRIEDNRSDAGYGGGIHARPGASPAPVRCFADRTLECAADEDCYVCADDTSVRCEVVQDCEDAGLAGPCTIRGPCLATTEAIVSDNVLRDNVADAGGSGGGGMLATIATSAGAGTHLVASGNVIFRNSAATDGGGLAVVSSGAGTISIEVSDNIVSTNDSARGGGSFIRGDDGGAGGSATLDIANNAFEINTATSTGGGLDAAIVADGRSQTRVSGNQFRSNTAGAGGGGARIDVAGGSGGGIDFRVTGNSVSANTAKGSGGDMDLGFALGRAVSAITALCRIDGNEVIGNTTTAGGGGIRAIVSGASDRAAVAVSVSSNEVRGNEAASHGGGVELRLISNGEAGVGASLLRDLVAENTAANATDGGATGAGVFAFVGGSAGVSALDLDFSTIASNTVDIGAAALEIESDTAPGASARVEVTNSILSGNVGTAVGGPDPRMPGKVMAGTGRTLSVRAAWNDVYTAGWEDFERTIRDETVVENNNLYEDPLLLQDYVPDLCSPSLDAAEPEADYSSEPQPNGLQANTGHLGGTASATQTPPDVNGDRQVDGMDLLRVTAAFAADRLQTPSRYDAASDLNGNGVVDGDDIAYVAAFFGFSCP